jgi:ribosomal protein S18 acetylase RimI-like enzyme
LKIEIKIEVYQNITKLHWFDQQRVSILLFMAEASRIDIKPVISADKDWIEEFYIQRWGSNRVVTRGRLYTVSELPGFLAWKSNTRIGLLTYQASGEEIEIVTLDSLDPGHGVGTALISEAVRFARAAKSRRLWLITTNDNTPALHFYQKNGFNLVKIHHDAIKLSRELKPEIPLVGLDGIPIRDEIELEYNLT